MLTEEQRKDQIVALLREREHYEKTGQEDRVNEVNASLRALGHKASQPRARAETRPAGREVRSTR